MIYRYNTRVVECNERSQVISAHKDPDAANGVRLERLNTGWWLTVENSVGGNFTFPLGQEKPDPPFEKGEPLIITLSSALKDVP